MAPSSTLIPSPSYSQLPHVALQHVPGPPASQCTVAHLVGILGSGPELCHGIPVLHLRLPVDLAAASLLGMAQKSSTFFVSSAVSSLNSLLVFLGQEFWVNRIIHAVTRIAFHWLNFSTRSSSLSAIATATTSISCFALASANDSCVAFVTMSGGQHALSDNHSGPFHHKAWLVTSRLRLPTSAGFFYVLT